MDEIFRCMEDKSQCNAFVVLFFIWCHHQISIFSFPRILGITCLQNYSNDISTSLCCTLHLCITSKHLHAMMMNIVNPTLMEAFHHCYFQDGGMLRLAFSTKQHCASTGPHKADKIALLELVLAAVTKLIEYEKHLRRITAANSEHFPEVRNIESRATLLCQLIQPIVRFPPEQQN